MEEEKKGLCENCKKQFIVSKLHLHEAYCRRNCMKCPDCGEFIDKAQQEEHFTEKHKKVPCKHCKVEIEPSGLQSHEDKICPMRPKPCSYCDLSFPTREHKSHQDMCGSRTRHCMLCSKYIMLKDYDVHEVTCLGPVQTSSIPESKKQQQQEKPEQCYSRKEDVQKQIPFSVPSDSNKTSYQSPLQQPSSLKPSSNTAQQISSVTNGADKKSVSPATNNSNSNNNSNNSNNNINSNINSNSSSYSTSNTSNPNIKKTPTTSTNSNSQQQSSNSSNLPINTTKPISSGTSNSNEITSNKYTPINGASLAAKNILNNNSNSNLQQKTVQPNSSKPNNNNNNQKLQQQQEEQDLYFDFPEEMADFDKQYALKLQKEDKRNQENLTKEFLKKFQENEKLQQDQQSWDKSQQEQKKNFEQIRTQQKSAIESVNKLLQQNYKHLEQPQATSKSNAAQKHHYDEDTYPYEGMESNNPMSESFYVENNFEIQKQLMEKFEKQKKEPTVNSSSSYSNNSKKITTAVVTQKQPTQPESFQQQQQQKYPDPTNYKIPQQQNTSSSQNQNTAINNPDIQKKFNQLPKGNVGGQGDISSQQQNQQKPPTQQQSQQQQSQPQNIISNQYSSLDQKKYGNPGMIQQQSISQQSKIQQQQQQQQQQQPLTQKNGYNNQTYQQNPSGNDFSKPYSSSIATKQTDSKIGVNLQNKKNNLPNQNNANLDWDTDKQPDEMLQKQIQKPPSQQQQQVKKYNNK